MQDPNINQPSSVEQLIKAGAATAVLGSQTRFIHEGHTFMVFNSQSGSNHTQNLVCLSNSLPPDARPLPKRKTGIMVVHDVASFIAYFNAHKEKGSIIVVDVGTDGARFSGILNYHGETANAGDHRVVFDLERSIEWNQWMKHNKAKLPQQTFVEHIEDCREFIVSPSAADLLKMFSGLEGKVDANFKQSVNTHTGAVRVAFEEDIAIRGGGTSKADGTMDLPERFDIAIAPFTNTSRIKATARVRIRVENRKLVFTYETGACVGGEFALNLGLITEQAVTELVAKLEEGTTVKPLLGSV